jgi:SnoaL-like domain
MAEAMNATTVSSATAARFRAAVESHDIEAASGLLAEEIVFHSPVTFHPYVGRETVTRLLAIVADVFEDFRYTDELAGGDTHALIFRAAVAGRELEGMDLLRFDSDGLIADFTVMVRPVSGLMPFAEKMAERVTAAGLATSRS